MDFQAHSHSCNNHSNGYSTDQLEATTNAFIEHHDNDLIRRNDVLRRLKIASALCCTFLLVEVAGGLLAGSLAILSDAAHLLADLAAFAVAICASQLATLPATSTYTFGFKRLEALAALFSMASLAVVSIFLVVEAVHRLWPFVESWVTGEDSENPKIDVDGRLMSFIALIGVIVNVALAFVLGEHHVHLPGGHDHSHEHEHEHEHAHSHGHDQSPRNHANQHEQDSLLGTDKSADRKEHYGMASSLSFDTSIEVEAHHAYELPPLKVEPKKNINLRAAYIHVLGDLAQSVAVLIAGLIIWWKPTWRAVDPICTILFCIFVFYSTIGVIRSSVSVLLEEVPPHLDWDEVYDSISSVKGVYNVHDLHIWSISHGCTALSVHASADNQQQALVDIHNAVMKYNVIHSTIQLQPNDIDDCITCGDGMNLCKQSAHVRQDDDDDDSYE